MCMLQKKELEYKTKQLEIEMKKDERDYEIEKIKLERKKEKMEMEKRRVEEEKRAHASVCIHCIVLSATSGLLLRSKSYHSLRLSLLPMTV